MLVLQDMIAFLGEERAHDHLNLEAAGLSCPYGALAVDMGVSICLVRADDDHTWAAVIERLDVAEHATTTIAMQAELSIAAPLPQGAVELSGNLFEDHSTYDSSTPQHATSTIGLADSVEPGR